MKKRIFITILFLCSLWWNALAQTTCGGTVCSVPIYVTQGSSGNFNYANWDWTNQDACNWQTYVNNIATCINPPFAPNTTRIGKIVDVYNQLDYTNTNPNHSLIGDKGWELINANFFSAHPYFILYNKYNATMRTFFYLPDALTPDPHTYYAILCSFHGTSPAGLAGGYIPANALDHYPSASPDEYISIVKRGTGGQWICADFNMFFDPTIGNSVYNLSQLEITLSGINNYQLSLSGSVTQADISVDPGSVNAGSTLNASEANAKLHKFFEGGQSALTEISDNIDKITASGNTSPAVEDNKKALEAGNTFGKLASIFEKASAVTSVMGTLLNVFDKVSGEAPTSETSLTQAVNLDVNLSGTMSLELPLVSNTVKFPGTQSNGNITTNLYDCPLGLINLNNTIEIYGSSDYERNPVDANQDPKGAYVRDHFISGYNGRYQKCRVNTDPLFTINLLPNMTLLDIKCAMMFTPTDVVTITTGGGPGYDPTSRYINNAGYKTISGDYYYEYYQRNPVYEDIANGKFILYEFAEDGRHKFGTPYVSPSCFKGLTYEIPLNTVTTFSFIALFKVGNNPNPIIIKYEYSTKNTWVNSGPRRYMYNIPVNNLTTPLPEYPFAYPYSNYYNNSYILNNNAINYNTTYTGSTIDLQTGTATTGTHFIPGFQATAISPYQCIGTNNIGNYSFTNCANSQNYRYASQTNIEENPVEELTLYPNPSKGQLTLLMNFIEEKPTVCAIYNTAGEEVYSNSFGKLKIFEKTIQLNVEDGLYLIKVIHGDKVSMKKILIINE